jgi:uncharacterized protein YaaQ
MIMAVIPRDEADRVLDALTSAGFTATFTESRGGMLRQAQYMLFIAVKKQDVERVLGIICQNCHSQVRVEARGGGEAAFPPLVSPGMGVSAQIGGAVVFIWSIERVEMY